MHYATQVARMRPAAYLLRALAFAALFVTAAPSVASGTSLQALVLSMAYEATPTNALDLSIQASLPEGTVLPAELVLPVPFGAEVLSTAEYLEDEKRPGAAVAGVLETRNGVPALVLMLTDSLSGNAELRVPNARVEVPTAGDRFEAGFTVTLPVDAENVYAAVAVPAGEGEVLSTDPSFSYVSEVQPDGRLYYYVESSNAVAGDEVRFYVDYHKGWADESVPWALGVVALVIGGAGVVLVITRRRRSATATADTE